MIQFIYYILFVITLVYGMYFLLSGLFAFKNRDKKLIKNHMPKHRFAIIIPSRNEEDVIGELVTSLKQQKYPESLYEIIVIPNNCTDNTAKVAKKAGANILKCTVPVKSKGEVLKFAFDKLAKRDDIDAYVVFDADNIVHQDFLKHMNNALCDGHRVAQCFRDSKNPSDNWISGSYSIFYWIQNFFFNKARMQMKGSSSINGTGFVIKKDVIDEFGFNTVTLTEDVEFTAQCAINNVKIMFVEDAITYDEQPVNFNASWKQRKRWSAGILQCLKTYYKPLIKSSNNNVASFDMFLVFLAPVMQVLGFILTIMLMLFNIFHVELYDLFSYMYALGIVFFLVLYLSNVLVNLFVAKYNNKKSEDIMSGILLFSFFILSWIPINIVCMVKKHTTWDPIKHNRKVKIEELVSDNN